MAEIKAKLGVDGESSFKRAISNATASVKEMNSALELAKSNYQATGDKSQFLKDKSDALKNAIDAQKSVIENIQAALENATKKYGENSTKVVGWRTALNNANKKLVDMQSELSDTEAGLTGLSEGMDTATTDAGELSDGLDKLNEKGDLSALKSGLDTISNTLKSAAQFAMQVGKALWGGTKDASDWADTLATQSQQFGIDTQTLQQWTYASKLIDTEVDTILKARQKMIKGLSSTSEEVQNAWDTLGISTTDSDGNFKNATELMWEALEALGQIENETERDNIAMALFGKSAAELNPLIKAGRESWEAMMKEGQSLGAVLDEKDVKRLAEFNDQWQRMNSVVTAMKYKFFAALSPAMGTIADALTKASQSLSEFLESAEGQEAIGKLGDSMAKFVTTLVDKLPELMPALSGLVDALTGLIGFIADHAAEITGVLGTLFVGSKVGSFGVGLAQAWTGLRGLFGGGKAAGAAGAAANAGSAAGAAAGGGGGFFSWLGTLAGKVAVPAAVAAATVATANTIDKNGTAAFNAHFEGGGAVAQGANGSESARLMADFYTALAQIQEDPGEGLPAVRGFLGGLNQEQLQMMHDLMPDLEMWKEVSEVSPKGISDWLAGLPDFTLLEDSLDIIDKVAAMFQEGGPFYEAGENAGTSVAEGAEATADLSGAGDNAGSTFVNTITGWFGAAFGAGQGLGESVANGVEAGLDIHSPSRVMKELGLFATEGFAEGIASGMTDVENAVGAMTESTIGTASRSSGGGSQGMANMLVSALRGMTVEIDGVKAGTVLTPTVSEILGMQADSWRYDEV